MQKTYLSRAVTRAMTLDHPIGDPTGGPAYREMREPISATIAIGTMAGTYAAAGSFAAMGLFSGLAFAGAAVSLIGNITGNKTLSKIGMIAGIAGGVGALAEGALGVSAGTLGETFGFGEAAAGASGMTGGAESALVNTPTASSVSGPMTPVVEGAQAIPIPEPSIASPTFDSAGADFPLAGTTTMTDAVQPPVIPGASDATAPLSMAPINEAMVQTANKSLDPIGSMIQQSGGAIDPGYAANLRQMTPMESTLQSVKDFGKGVMSFVKENPGAAMMASQAVGGLSEWLSGVPDAQLNRLEAEAGYRDAQAMAIQEQIAKEKRRRANLPLAYAQINPNVQVNPNASIPLPWQQQQPGLIAGARTPNA